VIVGVINLISKETKLPLSIVIAFVTTIAGGVWTTATLWSDYKALQERVFNIKPYDDAWVRSHTQYSVEYYTTEIAKLQVEVENLKERLKYPSLP
jgi:hypothetical protein